ncbi:MAG: sodium:calcium antiporter [Candidatus Dormibacteraeota bacterium]|uniref:Sodium:calcium antiporter n=1 Tax=Candidatus Aeolococcus gillhamiae TaxID=3127015 RepID=A0A2W5YZM4_9BACT|nr:sodium:calcium antiporter [Candidatus Dormibacteraeota bacterium]PZR78433.1 MAG: sodium:proton exchanger [Candidatus Dormibacter sp. RRmetagenome_bin12]
MSFSSLPFLIVVFLAAATAIWFAGIQLSRCTGEVDARFGLGSALGGLIILAVATNLPEIAIVSTAAVNHNFDIATGNLLGGISIQTVVLVALDGFGVRQRPLTNATNSLVQVLEGTLVISLLAVAIMATLIPSSVVHFGIDPSALLIVMLWLGGLYLVRRSGGSLPWRRQDQAAGAAPSEPAKGGAGAQRSIAITFAILGAAALVTLLAGVVLEESGSRIADRLGINGVIFGGTFLAAATALPELSTGLASVRAKNFELAVSDIFGGNAFLPVLFFPATLLAGQSVLGKAKNSDVLLAALGILLTTVYIGGLVFRPKRQYGRLGPDSIAVVVLYALGVVALILVSR